MIALPWHTTLVRSLFVYGPLSFYHSNKIKQTIRTQTVRRAKDEKADHSGWHQIEVAKQRAIYPVYVEAPIEKTKYQTIADVCKILFCFPFFFFCMHEHIEK